jgi:hypothetical protein
MGRKWTNIKGQQGQWYATVRWEDGETQVLPCVHRYYFKKGAQGPYYHDTLEGVSMEDARLLKHLEQIRSSRRVIVTDDEVDETKFGDGRFRRTGYVAVFDIDDLEIEGHGYRFRFVERYGKSP